MDLLTLLPFLIGIALFAITFVIRSRGKKQDVKTSTNSTRDPTSPESGRIPEIFQPKYGPLHIYFGSQTGAAHNYAKLLAEEAQKQGFDAKIIDLVDFHPDFFKDIKLAVFIMATHGEGEPTENAKKFNEYIISDERTGTEFKGLKFAVFSLGNKQYQFYCAQGKRTNEFLEKLGGERVYKYGEGDDNENLEDDFNAWKEGIWPELVKIAKESGSESSTSFSAPMTIVNAKSTLPFTVSFRSDLKEMDFDNYNAANDDREYDFQTKQYLTSATANFTAIRELRQKTHDGSTLHVEIDCRSAGITYKTAQNLSVYPENSSEDVEKTARLLDLNLDDIFVVEQNHEIESRGKFKYPLPSPISVRTYLTKFCDLQGALRKKQLKDLAQFCNEDNKNKLLFLASIEGKTEYQVQIEGKMKGLLDLIEEFDIKISLDNLIQIASPIMPRLYTIASSNKKCPDVVHLCVSAEINDLPDGKQKVGLTSSFLMRHYKQFLEGKSLGKARINVKESTFLLPSDARTPIIMIGPGAGIAPFKGFIDEKAHLVCAGGENPYGEMTLYFGCKGREWDHIYKDELAKHHVDRHLQNYHVAFSRDQEQKVYVQDLLARNNNEVSQVLFENGGTLYICGSMAMGKSVLAKLADIAASHYKMDAKEAHAKIEELEKEKKIIKELWG